MKKLVNKKSIILFITILLLCARMLYLYSLRCSHFIDEFYSMGFANSKGVAFFIYPVTDSDGSQHLKYYKEWSDGQDIHSYLTVDEGEEFDFLNVIDNKLQDTAPANFEIMVHFVCSFFPGEFSWAFPFSVNFVFFIASLILVFKISQKNHKNSKFGFINAYICMVFFSFTIAGSGAFTFLRMYGVLSFYALLMLFAVQNLLSAANKKQEIVYSLILYFAVFMGLFTHPLYVIYAFWLTAFTCLYLLLSKRIAESFKRGGTVLASLVTFVLVYPFNYGRVSTWMTDDNVTGYSFFTRLIFSNMHMFGESIGFYIPFTYANIISWLGILFIITFSVTCLCFLFRNEEWFKSFKTGFLKLFKSLSGIVTDIFKNLLPINYIAFLTVIAYMLTVTAVTPVNTQYYVARYFMPGMFPLIICFVSFVNSVWNTFESKKRYIAFCLSSILLIILLLIQSFVFVNPFYFNKPYDDEEILHGLTEGADVMIFGDRMSALYSLMVPLRDINSFYFGLYTDDVSELSVFPENSFYLMIRSDCFEEDDSRADLVDGLALEGSTDDFAEKILTNASYDYEIERLENFYSFAGDYAIYKVAPIL